MRGDEVERQAMYGFCYQGIARPQGSLVAVEEIYEPIVVSSTKNSLK